MRNLKRCIGLFVAITFVLASGISVLAKDDVKININKATVKELSKLKKVGPKAAAKIIEYREKNGPFKNPEDITKVPGIGSKIFEMNKDIIITGDKS
ncbi:MAG: helix-hairpin-helix domain-containing protein [Desulfobacterales bacterium]